MKPLKHAALAIALVLATATTVAAENYTKGVVKKVNLDKKKVTIIHEEIVNLEMPAMTMVFRTAEDEMLDKLNPGDKIEFVVERVNGKLTITELKE